MRNSMIRLLLTAVLLAGASPAYLAGQSCPDVKKITAGQSGPMITVRYLADDALEGRLAGSPGERCAGDFIAARFKTLGLKPGGDNGTYFQSFDLASVVNPHSPRGTGRNVIGIIEGTDPDHRSEYVIVGAHYDHLGWGPFGSTSGDTTPAIHNGADDNASGVAAMLQAAEYLKKSILPMRSIIFVAFSGEEEGLIGSSYFVNHPPRPIGLAKGMLNMDMVGRLNEQPLIVYGIGTASEWRGIVTKAAAARRLTLTLQDDGYGASDHTSFYLKDIPVLHFFSNVHGDYHKPSDDWQKIDAAGLNKVSIMVAEIAQKLGHSGTYLTLLKGAGKPPAPAGSSGGGYGAYLGTIPDFSPVPKGVKISGVRDKSPAQIAGLQAGDIIIRFDETEVADLQGMTDGLRARKPGDPVRVTVIRDGKELVLNAVLGTRSN